LAEQTVIPYGFERRLQRATFDETVEQVTAALKKEGFGVFALVDNPKLLPVVEEADRRIQRVLASLN
jgi:uncharacterized protein (DUF302 family)